MSESISGDGFQDSKKNKLEELIDALENGRMDVAKSIIRKLGPAALNSLSSKGSTPLHVAAAKGQSDVIKILINEKNVDIKAIDSNGQTAFHYAAKNNKIESINILNKHPESKSALLVQDRLGQTALHIAAQKDNSQIIKVFLNKDKELKDIKDLEGNKSHDYLNENSSEASKTILRPEREADNSAQITPDKSSNRVAAKNSLQPNNVDKERQEEDRVREMARSQEVQKAIELHQQQYQEGGRNGKINNGDNNPISFTQQRSQGVNQDDNGGNIDAHIDQAKESSQEKYSNDNKFSKKLPKNIELNEKEELELKIKQSSFEDLFTMLCKYCEIGNIQIVNRLLQEIPGSLDQTRNGETPLHIAAKNGNIEIFSTLISRGANPNIRNNSGQIACEVVDTNPIKTTSTSIEKKIIDVKEKEAPVVKSSQLDKEFKAAAQGESNVIDAGARKEGSYGIENATPKSNDRGANPNIRNNSGQIACEVMDTNPVKTMQIVDDKEKKESASSKKPSNVKAEDASRRGVGINISAISSYFPATEFKVTSAQEIKSSSRSDQSR